MSMEIVKDLSKKHRQEARDSVIYDLLKEFNKTKFAKEELAQIIYGCDLNDLSDKEKQYILLDERLN